MFDYDMYIAARQKLIEGWLLQVLPAPAARPAVLAQAMRHAVLTGGKRLRPIICLAACEVAGTDLVAARPAALAVELLHTYTLVHDDLPCMDDDATRRGQPTVWAKFGEANGVLAGDALQALAFEVLTGDHAIAGAVAAKLCHELAMAAGYRGVIAGQVEDLTGGASADLDTVDFVQQHKTAALFRAAARMGAIVAHADAATLAALETYGDNLGRAFQIIDDILDAQEGNPTKANELSCLHLLTTDEAQALATKHTQKACQALANLVRDAQPLTILAQRSLHRIY